MNVERSRSWRVTCADQAMKATWVFSLCTVLAALGCSGVDATDEDQQEQMATASSSRLTLEAKELWDAYVRETTSGAALQEGCVPKEFSPPTGTKYKGVAILFHGFTACPQQYF